MALSKTVSDFKMASQEKKKKKICLYFEWVSERVNWNLWTEKHTPSSPWLLRACFYSDADACFNLPSLQIVVKQWRTPWCVPWSLFDESGCFLNPHSNRTQLHFTAAGWFEQDQEACLSLHATVYCLRHTSHERAMVWWYENTNLNHRNRICAAQLYSWFATGGSHTAHYKKQCVNSQ